MKKKNLLLVTIGLVGVLTGSAILYQLLSTNYKNSDSLDNGQYESMNVAEDTVSEDETLSADSQMITEVPAISDETFEEDTEVAKDLSVSNENEDSMQDSPLVEVTPSISDSTETPSVENPLPPSAGEIADPTMAPSNLPTTPPENVPSAAPTEDPTVAPTQVPTFAPTQAPTAVPTKAPTAAPTWAPTKAPTPTPTPTPAPTKVPANVNTAANFTVENYAGTKYNLSDFFGKPIVINFFASWCGPCKSEMPAFNSMYKQYKDQVVFLMVDMVDGKRETKQDGYNYVSGQGFSFPVYYDTNQSAAYAYGITSYPTTYFIDANGNVSTYSKGAMSESTLKSKIDSLLR